MANIVEQAIIELQSVYKGGGAEKAKKDLGLVSGEKLDELNSHIAQLEQNLKDACHQFWGYFHIAVRHFLRMQATPL